jgi:N-acetyl-gamma-glutamyl-phosphate reductase
VVDAMSGVSGAGRKSEEPYSFVEVQGDARAYRTLRHPHEPEIAAILARYAKRPVELVFTPHLVPIARGILSTAYATLAREVDPVEILRHAYRGERFVRVVDSPDDVAIAKVVGTNDCVIGAAVRGKRVVVVSAIDNLIKGAAGQAMQNLNLVLGLEEATGLHHARRRRP